MRIHRYSQLLSLLFLEETAVNMSFNVLGIQTAQVLIQISL